MASQQELDNLRAFVSRAHALVNRRLVTSGGLDGGFSVNFDQTTGLRLLASHFDQEDMRAFLTDFRPFVMDGERVHLNRTMNVLDLSLTDSELRVALREIRAGWKAALQGVIGFQFNGDTYRADRTFDLIVNGFIFHDDAAKREVLDSVGGLGHFFMERQLLNLLCDGVRVIVGVSNVINEALDRRCLQ